MTNQELAMLIKVCDENKANDETTLNRQIEIAEALQMMCQEDIDETLNLVDKYIPRMCD
jgi:hypothetical protein